ncbi:MAG: hypothetical protein ACSHX0_01510 [Akkermansiaceae bacterium]
MAVEETFGIKISDAAAGDMLTPRNLIEHTYNAVLARSVNKPCLSQLAFHRVRRNLCHVAKCNKSEVKLEKKLLSFFPKENRTTLWNEFRQLTRLHNLPNLRFGRGLLFSSMNVKDLVRVQIIQFAEVLTERNQWSKKEVREVVRIIIYEQLEVPRFSDDDEFIRDLGLN